MVEKQDIKHWKFYWGRIPRHFYMAFAILAIADFLDILTTYIAIQQYSAPEANLFVTAILNKIGWLGFTFLKIIHIAFIVSVTNYIILNNSFGKRTHYVMTSVVWGLAIFMALVDINNTYTIYYYMQNT